MEVKLNLQTAYKVQPGQTETYVAFRTAIPKPPQEDAHLRHIFRFYISRAMEKHGEQEIYVLPSLMVGKEQIKVDVLAVSPDKYTVAICEPASVTPETESLLEVLKGADNTETIVVHSQYGNPGNVMDKFKEELQAGKFRLLAVVPPPFDDAYEYDIWMFETTFRDLFARE